MLITVYLNAKHGWGGVINKMNPEETKMLADLGIGSTMTKVIGILSLVVVVMTLIPQTFFAGNLLNAGLILYIMALALKTDNVKTALIEIPFLAMPLMMIYLDPSVSYKVKHCIKNEFNLETRAFHRSKIVI